MSEKKKNLSRLWSAITHRLKRKRINQNLLTYIIMVVLATAAWVVNKMGSTNSTSGTCDVEYYGLPQNSMLVPGLTTYELKINFSAKGTSLLGLRGKVPAIRIDLSKLDIRTFPESDSTLKFVTDDDIRPQVEQQLPTDFHFISLKPDTIMLDFGTSSRKKVPVVLQQNTTFARQYRMYGTPHIMPDSVTITGATSLVDTIKCIYTETLEASNISDSTFMQKVKFIIPKGVSCPLTTAQVTLNLEKFTERVVEVPIRQLNVPDSIQLRIFSQKATVKFNVGWNNYKKITREMFVVSMDYNDLSGIVRPRTLPLTLTKQPDDKGVTNISISPASVEYLVEKKAINDKQP